MGRAAKLQSLFETAMTDFTEQLPRYFCFTLVANYVLFSLTSDEFSRDEAKRNPIKAMQRKTGKNEDDSEKHTNGEWIDKRMGQISHARQYNECT